MYQSANDYSFLPYCSLGVKNADENELRSIATDPDSIHMYNVADFSFLLDIVDNLTDNLCNSVKGPGKYEFSSTHALSWLIKITEEQYTGFQRQAPSTFIVYSIPDLQTVTCLAHHGKQH